MSMFRDRWFHVCIYNQNAGTTRGCFSLFFVFFVRVFASQPHTIKKRGGGRVWTPPQVIAYKMYIERWATIRLIPPRCVSSRHLRVFFSVHSFCLCDGENWNEKFDLHLTCDEHTDYSKCPWNSPMANARDSFFFVFVVGGTDSVVCAVVLNKCWLLLLYLFENHTKERRDFDFFGYLCAKNISIFCFGNNVSA